LYLLALPTITILAACAVLLSLTAVAVALIGLRRQRQLQARYEKLFVTADAGSVQDLLAAYASQVAAVVQRGQDENARLAALEAKVAQCLQRTGVVRYNPFADTGGDQSFALVLANADGDGVALSSLHARGLTRVYAKPLVRWASAYQLTDEENKAIGLAQTGHTDR